MSLHNHNVQSYQIRWSIVLSVDNLFCNVYSSLIFSEPGIFEALHLTRLKTLIFLLFFHYDCYFGRTLNDRKISIFGHPQTPGVNEARKSPATLLFLLSVLFY